MVLGNYVRLEPGVAKRLHFTASRIEDREVRDSVTGQTKRARAWVGDVDEEDGGAVRKTFSTLSDKLARVLQVWAADGTLPRRLIIITQRGSGFATEYEVQGPLR